MLVGLQGVELGGQVIKRIIVDLVADFPRISQFASLSPVPGFRDWLLDEIGSYVRLRGELVVMFVSVNWVVLSTDQFRCPGRPVGPVCVCVLHRSLQQRFYLVAMNLDL